MKYLNFDNKLSIKLIITFVFMTVIGTLSHEFGHYSVARLLGYNASINYGSTSYWSEELRAFQKENIPKYKYEMENKLDYPTKTKYLELTKNYKKHQLLFTLGGPIQTILTGTIGLILLILYRKKYFSVDKVSITRWIYMFLALFWLRQTANLITAIENYFKRGRLSTSGDEMKLAYYFDLNIWSIQVITVFIGFLVLIYVVKLLPNNIKLTFLISGFIG